MIKFILRWIISAVALYAAIELVPGVELITTLEDQWLAILLLGLVFGLLNALVRPLLLLLTCPFILLTLGLGTLLINTLLFYLTGLIGAEFGWGFRVESFWAAFLGALVVSLVSFVLSVLLKDELNGRRVRRQPRPKNHR